MKKDQQPPRLANWFLEWYCRPDMLEDLQGSLYEYYNERVISGSLRTANWMFILDVIMHFRPHNIKRRRQTSNIMIRNHIKISLRNIWKYKLSSTLNIAGLATGLASFILIVLWVNLELNYDRFHEKGGRIYRISNTFTSESETFSQALSGPALGGQLHQIFAEVEDATRYFTTSEKLEINNEFFFESELGVADPNFLDMFSFQWLAGDMQTALKDPNSILLTKSTAFKYFGEEEPLGETISMDGILLKVTGIIADPPENSQLKFKALIPIQTMFARWGVEDANDRWGGGWFHSYLLLKEGTDPVLLQEEITAFIGEKLTDWAADGMYYEYFLTPLYDIHLQSDLRYDYASNGSLQSVIIFISAAVLILLLACINYVNLATANAIHRSKEVGLRKIIGAANFQLVTQYLVESFLIVIISILLALGIVYYLLPFFGELTGYTQIELLTLDHIGFLLILIVTLSLLAGVFPAILISKVSSLKVVKGNLKSGTQFNVLRKTLVVAQFTVTVVILISMLVINDQMRFIQNSNLGMKTEGVLHINFRGMTEVSENASVLKEKLLQISAISDVSYLMRGYPVYGLSNSTTLVENGEGAMVMSSIYTMRVDEDFTNTFGAEMMAGRFYSKDFPTDSTSSIVVNEACIGNFGWGDAESALGKKFGEPPYERTVIGVVKNFHFEALHRSIEPVRLLPVIDNDYSSMALRANVTNTYDLISDIEEVWKGVVPTVPLDISFMEDDIKNQYTAEYNFRTIFTVFSIISMIIGCLGLFGLATAASNQRLREVSIRKVLGASVSEIMILMNKDFILLIILAALLASPVAYYFMNNWLDNFTYHIAFRWQYVMWALVGSLVITILTISVRAVRTALTNPASVLRD